MSTAAQARAPGARATPAPERAALGVGRSTPSPAVDDGPREAATAGGSA